MSENTKALVMASFVADSLSLGAHWIYDQKKIIQQFGKINRLEKPLPDSFHPTKSAGEFTHYGDQTLLLLTSIAQQSGFNLEHFANNWQLLFADYDGYLDNATQTTLTNFKKNNDPRYAGSTSSDLGGAARIAPLVYLYYHNEEQLIQNIKSQTAMTHNNQLVLECALFFALATIKTLSGVSPVDAIQQTTEESFSDSLLSMLVQKGMASCKKNTSQAIADLGQMCDSNVAFPGAIHLICKYEQNFSYALVENVMAGGDSSARGMLSGMLLGAFHGIEAIPSDWLTQLKKRAEIEQMLEQIDSYK
jgi:ADP-ribosylglycohydrolase